MPQSNLRPYLALTLSLAALGFSAIFVRWANASGLVISFYRMGIAVLVTTIPFFFRSPRRIRLSRRGIGFAVLAGLFFSGDLVFWAEGINRSGATNPTLLGNTAPLWVGLGAMLFLKERRTKVFWIGLCIAMVGAGSILGLDSLRGFSFGLGSFFGLVAGFFYGAYFLLTQRGRESLDALTYFWISTLSSAVILLTIILFTGKPLTGYPPQTYLSFLALGIVIQVTGHFAVQYALGHLPASIVSPTLLGQPIATALLAVPLLGEPITSWQAISGITVLIGVYLVHRSKAVSQAAAAPARTTPAVP